MSGIVTITSEGAFDASIRKAINANFATLGGAVIAVGTVYFLNPSSGLDSNDGLSSATPVKTLSQAFGLTTGGNNDTIVLMGDGTTAATARVDASFTWNKNATHLVGYCSPVLLSQRARIAPTATTTAFTPFFTISGSGCIFQNIQWFHGFNTGTTNQINMVVTGSRNYFVNCHIAGMGDATSAGSAGSRSLKIGSGGSGENVFKNCTIGLDTGTKRTNANASVEFTGDTVRNAFIQCYFPIWAGSTAPLLILGTGAACMDRWQDFDRCLFVSSIKSGGGSLPAVAISLTSASPGGLIVVRNCTAVGITAWGDTNGLANTYVDGGAPTAGSTGLAVNPQ